MDTENGTPKESFKFQKNQLVLACRSSALIFICNLSGIRGWEVNLQATFPSVVLLEVCLLF